jgi:uncharacterized protein YkwD
MAKLRGLLKGITVMVLALMMSAGGIIFIADTAEVMAATEIVITVDNPSCYVEISDDGTVIITLQGGGIVEFNRSGEMTLLLADGRLLWRGSSGIDVPNVPFLTSEGFLQNPNRYEILYYIADIAFERFYVRLAPSLGMQSEFTFELASERTLPNRRLTDSERAEWIAEYNEMGGASEFELEIVRLTNAARAEHGLAPLQIDENLMLAARFYAQTLAQSDIAQGRTTAQIRRIVHDYGPYGSSRNTATAFGGRSTGSNSQWGLAHTTPQSVVDRWLESPGHRANMLRRNAAVMGIGTQMSDTGRPYHYMFIGLR